METIQAALSVLILLAAWGAWRRSYLDRTRDRLFDMRDDLRAWFIANGYKLDHPMYRELRDLINAHLRFTEDIRFVGMVVFSARITPDLERHMSEQIDSRYATEDERLRDLAGSVRHDSGRIMQKYMMGTSTFFATVVLVSLPFALLAAIRKDCHGFWLNFKIAVAQQLDQTSMRPSVLEAAAILQRA